MPKIVRTARGDLIDFDQIRIKQQLAQAPMNIEVANRKKFIDTQESKKRGQRAVPTLTPEPTPVETPVSEVPRPTKKKK